MSGDKCCIHILLTGKRKGKYCAKKNVENRQYCKNHAPKYPIVDKIEQKTENTYSEKEFEDHFISLLKQNAILVRPLIVQAIGKEAADEKSSLFRMQSF